MTHHSIAGFINKQYRFVAVVLPVVLEVDIDDIAVAVEADLLDEIGGGDGGLGLRFDDRVQRTSDQVGKVQTGEFSS